MDPTIALKSTKKIADYGMFDAKDGSFLLTATPPRKWSNIHFNEPGEHEVYAETSNIGDGPVVFRDNAGNTCNLVGYDSKYVYLRDEETKVVFCPSGEPVPTAVRNVKTRFAPAFTETSCEYKGLKVAHRVFVPRTELFEAHTVTIKNTTAKERSVSVFLYAMFQLTGNTASGGGVWKDNDTEIHPELCGVYAKNRERSVPTDRFKGYLVTLNKTEYVASTGYRDFFTRTAFSLAAPVILDGSDLNNLPYRGPDSAAAVQVRVMVPAKGSVRVDYLLGQCSGLDDVAAVVARTTPESLDAACTEQAKLEESRRSAFSIDTGLANATRDALINNFSKKQMVSYLINKSGFRDNMQNDMGVALFDYPMARANILRAVSSQYENGCVPHGFRPWNLHQYSDKPAWMLHCIPWVIKESGDFALLDQEVGYYKSELKEPIWQHMIRAMRFMSKDVGSHGLCDQHHADWNDGLEPSEKTGARESVMVTQQLCLGLVEMAELARRRNEPAIEREANDLHEHFMTLLNRLCWDGEWYVRTLTGSGYTLGSKVNPEGKIFINTQSWAVLSQSAPPERARVCMESVDKYIEGPYGFAICEPAFTKFDERIGKYSASRPYYAENGGCYNHAAGFKLVADCMMGRPEQAWRTWLKVAPDSPWNPVGNSKTEPFSFTNCYSRTDEWPGMSMYPWRTGTCAWFTQGVLEWILGARRHYDGLLIDPCLTASVPRAKVVRVFRGSRYEIEIDNTSGGCRGVRELYLDGRRTSSQILKPDGKKHKVKVFL
ncbi:MAG: hypothetical protein SFY80_04125 [Verrucomicrobiota bacterium]|nr:hypothetical protein [Verrucomicrobiota bacterium]